MARARSPRSGDPNPERKRSFRSELLEEFDRIVDDAELEDAFAEIGMRLEQLVELVQCSFDLGIGAVDQLLDGAAGLIA